MSTTHICRYERQAKTGVSTEKWTRIFHIQISHTRLLLVRPRRWLHHITRTERTVWVYVPIESNIRCFLCANDCVCVYCVTECKQAASTEFLPSNKKHCCLHSSHFPFMTRHTESAHQFHNTRKHCGHSHALQTHIHKTHRHRRVIDKMLVNFTLAFPGETYCDYWFDMFDAFHYSRSGFGVHSRAAPDGILWKSRTIGTLAYFMQHTHTRTHHGRYYVCWCEYVPQ